MEKFKEAIKRYLDKRAAEDELFAKSYAKEKKSIDECCKFIIGEASKRRDGQTAVISDDEVYGLAVHYYDEDDIKVEKVQGYVKSTPPNDGATFEPTEEDRVNARRAALERLIKEEYNRLHMPTPTAKRESEVANQMTLF